MYAAGAAAVLLAVPPAVMALVHTQKSVPAGLSVTGDFHVSDVELLQDITYEKDGETVHEQEIMDSVLKVIEKAEDHIVADMFLFNGEYNPAYDFPDLSGELAGALAAKKRENPEMEIVVLTDPINTGYDTYEAEALASMDEAGVDVIYTDLSELRDSNPLYSGWWRSYLQWWEPGENGILPNPFSPEAPDFTVPSYASLLNFKANHRKVVLSEKEAVVSTGNPHDASAWHSNTAIHIEGPVVDDLLASEKAAASFSGEAIEAEAEPAESRTSGPEVRLITEGGIREALLEEINEAENGDVVWMGMFYLSDRGVIGALKEAEAGGADVRLILDPNKDAFGREKAGIPNRQTAAELMEAGVEVRWYNTQGEQYHTKTTFIQRGETSSTITGSSNLTRRNLQDYNLETNLHVKTEEGAGFSEEMESYFTRLWENEGGLYTVDSSVYEDDSLWKYWLYRFQEASGLSTF
ncbi:phospholipase [Alkalicoccus urumqiensis]|uniref:Phospholipase n=2 Tax=Alkalicoccus urumqiensis TaxID=1548213 RepID=A0A2P6MM20_ALKUR|nr:phospholipase [Alkalicoccus urumqiensis]